MRLILIFILALFTTSPAFAQCDDGEAVLKLGFAEDAQASPRRRFAKAFADTANPALQGKACVLSIVSNALYDDDKALAAVKSGVIQMAMPRLEKLSATSPRLIVFSLPFAFRDIFALERFLDDPVYQRLLRPLLQDGLTPLQLLHEGFAQIAGTRPIHDSADVRGLRFRRAGAPDISSRPDLLGASARVVSDEELAKALKEKQIEAVTGFWSFLAQNKVDMVLDGATETNHRYSGFMLVASKELWDVLDEDVRTKLAKGAADAAAVTNAATLASEKAAMDTIIGRDRPVRTLTSKQRNAWLLRLEPTWERVARDAQLLLAIRGANAMP